MVDHWSGPGETTKWDTTNVTPGGTMVDHWSGPGGTTKWDTTNITPGGTMVGPLEWSWWNHRMGHHQRHAWWDHDRPLEWSWWDHRMGHHQHHSWWDHGRTTGVVLVGPQNGTPPTSRLVGPW